MSSVSGFGSLNQVSQLYQSTVRGKNQADGTTGKTSKTADNSAAMKIRQANRAEQTSSIQDGIKLSEGAQKVLDEL